VNMEIRAQAAAMASLDDGDRGEEDYREFAPPPPSARFAAAVQAAVAAAGTDAQRDEPGCGFFYTYFQV